MNWQNKKYFEVDKDKLTDLMTGTNIYSNKMDFIREYLQNAMDATRIQMWMDIKKVYTRISLIRRSFVMKICSLSIFQKRSMINIA